MWDNPFVEFEMDVIKMNRLLTNYLRNGTIGIYVCFTFSDIQVTTKHRVLYLRVIF